MKEQLNPLEITKIEQFCGDEVMYQAVEKVILQGIYAHGVLKPGLKADPLINGAFSLVQHSSGYPMNNEVLGEHLRAVWQGVNAMKNAFDSLKTIKSEGKPVETPYNEAI
jgi:hypothetical protein